MSISWCWQAAWKIVNVFYAAPAWTIVPSVPSAFRSAQAHRGIRTPKQSFQCDHQYKKDSAMWFMNKFANPFVKLILRSPLHGLMSAAVLLVSYRGRKSGKKYTLPVQYVQDGNNIYIVPGYPEKKTWWHNLEGGKD